MERHQEARTTEIFREGKWSKYSMTDLKKGDRFRMFEPNGEAIGPMPGIGAVMIAKTDAKDVVSNGKLVAQVTIAWETKVK